MADEQSALRLVKEENGKKPFGQPLTVSMSTKYKKSHGQLTGSTGSKMPTDYSYGRSQPTNDRVLFVYHVPPSATNEELRNLFSQNPQTAPVDCKIITDPATGKSRGYAFVTYADPQQAADAIRLYNHTNFKGNELDISLKTASSNRRQPGSGYRGGRGYGPDMGQPMGYPMMYTSPDGMPYPMPIPPYGYPPPPGYGQMPPPMPNYPGYPTPYPQQPGQAPPPGYAPPQGYPYPPPTAAPPQAGAAGAPPPPPASGAPPMGEYPPVYGYDYPYPYEYAQPPTAVPATGAPPPPTAPPQSQSPPQSKPPQPQAAPAPAAQPPK